MTSTGHVGPWMSATLSGAEKGKCDRMGTMTKKLKEAMDEASNLPEADQEKIGQDLLSHVEKLQRLRGEIDKGLHSLDAGEGRELNIQEFIRHANARHGVGVAVRAGATAAPT